MLPKIRDHSEDTRFIFILGIYARLSARELEILIHRLVYGKTLVVCGKLQDPQVSRERIRQIEAMALSKIRRYLGTKSGKLNYR